MRSAPARSCRTTNRRITMLDPNQRAVLAAFFVDRLPSNPAVGQLSIFVGDEVARQLPTLPSIKAIVDWLIDRALNQDQPDCLVKIIRTVDDGDAQFATIVAIAERLEADAAVWAEWRGSTGASAIDPLHVHDGRPFLDRDIFRGYLPQPGIAGTPSCILVEGETGSGKSYLYEYLKRFAFVRKSFEIGFATVGASNARGMTPLIVATAIAAGLRTSFQHKPRMHEDPTRHAKNLATWIIEDTPERSAPSLVVLDGFDADGVSDPTFTFIEELISGVANDEEAKKRLCILLLGYSASRLESLGLQYDRCTLEYVGGPHISQWLKQKFPGRPEYQYNDTAEEVIENIPTTGETRLLLLNSLLQAASAEFEESQ